MNGFTSNDRCGHSRDKLTCGDFSANIRLDIAVIELQHETFDFLRTSLDSAKLGDRDKLDGFRRLERLARRVEAEFEPAADFDAVIAHENEISSSVNGRSVFDGKTEQRQLTLF